MISQRLWDTKDKMKIPMINATRFNVGTENDEYGDLRMQMVDDLTADELNQPANVLKAMLEDLVWDMFTKMDDDALQDHYDNLMEAKNEEMVADPKDIENLLKEKN